MEDDFKSLIGSKVLKIEEYKKYSDLIIYFDNSKCLKFWQSNCESGCYVEDYDMKESEGKSK